MNPTNRSTRSRPTRRRAVRSLAAALALSLGLAPATVSAADTDGKFEAPMLPAGAAAAALVPKPIAQALGSPRLAGSGDLRWFGMRLYSAQLWVGPQGLRPKRLDADPFALQLSYRLSLKGTAIAERSDEEIARMGIGDAPRRSRWLSEMKRVFPDVASGDRLTGVHLPGTGTRFYHNDRPVGTIDDPAFGPAFFAIWLDDRTVAPLLRDALLRDLNGR